MISQSLYGGQTTGKKVRIYFIEQELLKKTIETEISDPVKGGTATTFKRQISWSPEGLFLCISHAYEHPKNVAYVIIGLYLNHG